jgi:hypothetical protein
MDRPAPKSRNGLALIAVTAPDIAEPSNKEVKKALPRLRKLLSTEELRRLKSSIPTIVVRSDGTEVPFVCPKCGGTRLYHAWHMTYHDALEFIAEGDYGPSQ